MVCQACFIFLLQSSFLLIYASNASFREASKISSPFSICSSVMVNGYSYSILYSLLMHCRQSCKIAPSYRLLQTVFPCFQLQNFCKLRDLHHISTIHKTLLLPLILLHIYTSICLKLHTLVFQKHLLLSPAWCSTPCMVHNSVAGILPVKFCHT